MKLYIKITKGSSKRKPAWVQCQPFVGLERYLITSTGILIGVLHCVIPSNNVWITLGSVPCCLV